MSHYSRTPLSHVVLGLTFAVIVSGETTITGDIAPDLSPRHLATMGGGIGSWLGNGETIVQRLGVLNAFR